MTVHKAVLGEFETRIIQRGIRSYGFPSVFPPQVGDLFVINRGATKALYQLQTVSKKCNWDNATFEMPEIGFYVGEMKDVVELNLWTEEIKRVLGL